MPSPPSTDLAIPPRASRVAGDIEARLSYVVPGAATPVSYACEPPPGEPWESGEFVDEAVHVADARKLASRPRLHVHGFELMDAPTAVRDFQDRAEVESVYYDEALGLALAATGGARGFVFDHLVRKRDPGQPTLGFGRQVKGRAPTANGRVHNDYTEASGQRRLRLVLGDAANRGGPYCIVNVWRSIAHPVLDAPLALCDARTVSVEDAVVSEVRYPGRTGEIYLFRRSPRHRWHFFPEMRKQEAVVFKQYDSRLSGTSRFTPHSAFAHPAAPPDAPARQSIEARVLVLFE